MLILIVFEFAIEIFLHLKLSYICSAVNGWCIVTDLSRD